MKIYIQGLFFCFIFFSAKSQELMPKVLLKAELCFDKRAYQLASDYYSRCLSKKYVDYECHVLQRLGDCNRMLNHNVLAEDFYKRSVHCSSSDSALFHYGQVLKKNKKYDEARQQFFILSHRYPDSLSLIATVASCDSALKWLSQTTLYQVSLLEKLNSEYSDISPVPHNNGIVFSSNRENVIIKKKSGENNAPFYNLYFALLDSIGTIKSVRNFSSQINSGQHETAPCFDATNTTVYYTSTRTDKDHVNRLKLYSAEENNGHWKNRQSFFLNDSSHSFAHPSVDQKNRMFFFASDLPGGYGGTDIYVCFNIENKWSNPVNLGPVVNTAGNELYPSYHESGSLYFSSNGHIGMGGYDLYEATQKKGEWTTVINMKLPINSSDDDFSIYFNADKKTGYFSSNRTDGKGSEDIYFIELKQE